MRDTLINGGPDDAGSYINDTQTVGLAQRRLSIIDLSQAGHQPMRFNNLVIVYNGEIYNYLEIAEELKLLGYTFNGGSDTEVILKAFDCWSYKAVEKFRGMFSFAIWNEITEKLLLCRDRVGVKPLYFYKKDGLFMFASELKAFHQHSDFDKTIDQDAVNLFLQTGYIKSPLSIYKYAHKIKPGSFLEIDTNLELKTWNYWNVRNIYDNIKISESNEQEIIIDTEKILAESFKLRMVADVPVGLFLSGGVDSTLVTALLQKDLIKPLKTFTIGFKDNNINEAHYAKKIANHLGTDHTELYCEEKDFLDIINELPDFYDEPFGDSSAIPTHLVSKIAREKVKVSLSADGGDEIFAGYNRYLINHQQFDNFKNVPKVIKQITGSLLNNISHDYINKLISILPISENYKKNVDARVPKLIEILKSETPIDFFYSSTLFITPKNLKKLHKHDSSELIFDKNLNIKNNLSFSAFGVLDIESYLEGDILAKIDRASMQVGLEGREPFLDHKIIEFALSLPDSVKIKNGQTKWILRQILNKYVPSSLMERPKMGFGLPLNEWLSKYLIKELNAIYIDEKFIECFLFDKNELTHVIKKYLKGHSQSPYLIWYLYCLHQWYLRWK